MLDKITMLLCSAVILLYGVFLSSAFAGVHFTKKNILNMLVFYGLASVVQIILFLLFSEEAVRKLYPLITHLPLVVMLCVGYRKRLMTALIAVFTTYLFCQPAKWLGILAGFLFNSSAAQNLAHTAGLLLIGAYVLICLVPDLAEIFNKEPRDVVIFGIVPAIYYVFDYTTAVYTDLWMNSRVIMEFLPVFLAVVYVIFCFLYYKEYEQKADAQRNEQIIRMTVEQRSREMDAVKRREKEIRILRHDMRLFLSSLAIPLKNGDTAKAEEMIASYISLIDGTRLEQFCGNDIINYVLSDFAAKCQAEQVDFNHVVQMEALLLDEMLFASILSNALDNAINAQKKLPESERCIKLMLKTADEKLLLSVKNPFMTMPNFVDGLPISNRKGHGYGTQSIRHMTERLGGNCHFSVQDGQFVLRVIVQNTPGDGTK